MTGNPPPMIFFIQKIDKLTQLIGYSAAWLLLAMVFIESLVVVLRYGFDFGSLAMQESVTYLHASCFLLGITFALKEGEHVRVDIFYRNFSPRNQAIVNITGGVLFLLPFCLFVIWSSLHYVEQAWAIKEVSSDAGGIAGVYLLKTLIPIFALLLMLQGLAEIARNLLVLFPPSHNNTH